MANFNLDGFVNEGIITSGLAAPIALGFLPDNRMLLLEKSGQIFIADPNSGAKSLYLDISNVVNSGQERGLLEIAIPPDFDPLSTDGKNLIYLFYTRSADTNRAVIGSFAHEERSGGLSSEASANSEKILWTDTDGYVSCCHYGGGLDFGPDGKVWLTSSDKFNTSNGGEGGPDDDWTADVEHTSGKIIRINRDGSIPNGKDGWPANPYADGVIDGPYPTLAPDGKPFQPDPSIWAYGLRNPFRADWDETYGKFYIGEVGGNQGKSTDDIHIASLDQAGAFYGWNFYEGRKNAKVFNADRAQFDPADFPQPDNDLADPTSGDYFSAPIYDIPHSSLTGGFVYRGDMFPEEFDGVYFFGNYESNYIKFLDLNETGDVVEGVYDFKPSGGISGSTTNVVFLEQGIDGALYYINYAANGGQVQRITFNKDQPPLIFMPRITDDQGEPDDLRGTLAPLNIVYSATVSDMDTPFEDLTYRINFGDSTVVSGTPDPVTGAIKVAHQYSSEGSYTATLRVSDSSSSTLSQSFVVTVGPGSDNPPKFDLVTSDIEFAEIGDLVTFTAFVSDIDDPAQLLTYTLNFGDGTQITGSPDADGKIKITHTYGDNDVYNAFFIISDDKTGSVRSKNIPILVGDSSELPVTDGLVFQVEAFIKIGLAEDGTTVTEWLDQSGVGNNLQAAGNPQLVENATPSGQSAIVLDGVGDYLFREDTASTRLLGLAGGNAPRTMFFVVDYEDVTNAESAGLVYGKPSKNQSFGLTLNNNTDDLMINAWGGRFDLATNTDGVINPATGQQRGFISHAVVFDGTTYKHYLDGVEIDSGSKTFDTALTKLLIGQNLNGGETAMSVAAGFIYDRALNANEFTAVENYIQRTYIATGGNQLPIAIKDNYSALSGQKLSVPFSTGLLNNDIDDGLLRIVAVNGQPFTDGDTFSLANGLLSVNADGAFSYTANASFAGSESFTYTVSDGTQTDTATVNVTVSEPSGNSLLVTDGLVAQLESDLNVIEENGVVTEWLSGAGTNMDLVASGDPVLIHNATPSGQAAISLDGGLAAFGENGALEGDSLQRVSPGQSLPDLPTGNEPRTMYFVVDYKATNGVYAGVSYGKGSQNNAFGLTLNGKRNKLTVQGWRRKNDYTVSSQNGRGNNDGSAGDDWFIHSVRYDGATIRHYRDDQLIDTDVHKFNTIVQKFIIGAEINNAGFSALDVAAVLVYDKELDDTEHSQTLQYLTEKYLTVPAVNTSRVDQAFTHSDATAGESTAAAIVLTESSGAKVVDDAAEQPIDSDRITEDLLALYLFDESDGTTIKDTAGVGEALDLSIDDPTGVSWGEGTLTLDDPTVIFSDPAADKLTDAVTGGALTLEAWFASDSLTQGRLAPILTLSAGAVDAALSLFSPDGSAAADLTHLVYTQDVDGNAAIYINGTLATADAARDLPTPDQPYQLILGGSESSNPAWLGTLDMVAIYGQSFDADEVTQNFLAGPK